ncbi:MAG: hypothetical protein NTW19_01285 [Planctomycetota bacterium]|nr:hypothetical protein [Planctomycetota bacterium]
MTFPLIGTGGTEDVQRAVAQALTSNGLPSVVRGHSSSLIPPGYDLAIEVDASVRGERRYEGIAWFPIEVKTRILNGVTDWEAIVPKTLEICQYLGGRVNHTTGHHMHVSFEEAKIDFRAIRSIYIKSFIPLR